MTVIYRTDGPWGSGKGSNLTSAEVDGNFYDHEQRIVTLESEIFEPRGIESVSVIGNNMTITFTDATTAGPFLLPVAAFNFTGAFQPDHDYEPYDLLIANEGLYLVINAFTSGSTFLFGSDSAGPWMQLILPFRTDYDIGFFFPGRPGNQIQSDSSGNRPMFSHILARDVTFPQDLDGSFATLIDSPAADLSFDIVKNGVSIGSIDFLASETTGSFNFPDDVDFVAGDNISVLRPTELDAIAQDLTVTIGGILTGLD